MVSEGKITQPSSDNSTVSFPEKGEKGFWKAWRKKPKLAIAFVALLALIFLLFCVLAGVFVLEFYDLHSKGYFYEMATIMTYGVLGLISLIIGFIAGASLDSQDGMQ